MKAGARAGCSISVSNKCKTPWWKIILGTKQMDFKEREQCEEREMSSCMALAEDACISFAKEKCIPAFQEARIATESSSEVGNAALERVTVEEEGSTNYKVIPWNYQAPEMEKLFCAETGCGTLFGDQLECVMSAVPSCGTELYRAWDDVAHSA